jgi:hypothetical protein
MILDAPLSASNVAPLLLIQCPVYRLESAKPRNEAIKEGILAILFFPVGVIVGLPSLEKLRKKRPVLSDGLNKSIYV